MCDIRDFKVGDIMIVGTMRNRQFFYVYNIKGYVLEMSGISEDDGTIFEKNYRLGY